MRRFRFWKQALIFSQPCIASAAIFNFWFSKSKTKETESTDEPQLVSPDADVYFETAVAFSPKNPPKRNSKFITFPVYCGEDAFFIARNRYASVLGIADGVGGWATMGVDPAEFSWQLMNNCRDAVEKLNLKSPLEILSHAYRRILNERQVRAGSSTACIISLEIQNSQPTISFANLGDSGFMLIRDNQLIFKTMEQQHYFNAPYQLSISPNSSRENISDQPEDAMLGSLPVKENDLIVLATDGLFDNLFDKTILSIIKEHEDLQSTADAILKMAKEVAKNTFMDTPFSLNARKNGVYYRGGKVDDITIVLAKVKIK